MLSFLRPFRRPFFALGILGTAALACASNGEDADTADQRVTAAPGDGAPETAVALTDPATMQLLESRGLTLGKVLGAKGESGKELLTSGVYAAIVDTVAGDIRDIESHDPDSGVGFNHVRRLFDADWLRSGESRFELVGVTNRLDLRTAKDCGQLRLVYRLAYKATKTSGRLPLTVNVLIPQANDGQGCKAVAKSWLAVRANSADDLLQGPLKAGPRPQWIEINYQSTKWPTDARPDFSGQAEYILRSFTVTGGSAVPNLLRNTPRPDLDDAAREELRQWIGDNLDAIDMGGAVLPDKFLAQKAVSVAAFGSARLVNRPFSQLLGDAHQALSALPLASTKQLRSVAALVRRLDTMSCQGCHQARAIGGFHLPGEERTPDTFNTLTVGRSPHLEGILGWRRTDLQAVADGSPSAVPVPFAERALKDPGGLGAQCGLGDVGFAPWTCGAGLRCVDANGDVVGVCTAAAGALGALCETGRVSLDANPTQDKRTDPHQLTCDTGLACSTLGSPGGLCRSDCSADKVGTINGTGICGVVTKKTPNIQCLEHDLRPFTECAQDPNILSPVNLQRCNANVPCRDDYACMRVKGAPPNEGSCVPPYFAFQLKVEGHMFDDVGQ